MNKVTKILIIVASSLLVLGGIVFTLVMSSLSWDFSKLNTLKYAINVHEIEQEFDSIFIETDTADVKFILSTDGKNKVECLEQEKLNHKVSVVDGVLTVKINDERSWFEHVTLFGKKTHVNFYLSSEQLDNVTLKASTGDLEIGKEFSLNNLDVSVSTGDVTCKASVSQLLKVKVSTGDIDLSDLNANKIELRASTGDMDLFKVNAEEVTLWASTGDMELISVTCKILTTEADTGDISLTNVIASQSFNIKRSTGDVEFNRVDSLSINVETSTGDVEGTLLSGKIFDCESSSGKVQVPNSTDGGICKVRTSTGRIKLFVQN